MHQARCAVVLALVAAGCSGLGHISVTQNATTTVPKATVVESLLGAVAFSGFDDFDLSQNSSFKNQGINKNQVSSVNIQTFTLEITDPAGQDFSFLQSLKFYAESDGLPKTLVADGSNFGTATKIALDLAHAELSAFVTAPSMTLVTEVEGHAPPNDSTIAASVVFDVAIDLKGAVLGK